MEKVLKVICYLKKEGLIKDFAIGGGIAVLYYTEPFLTYDLDIYFIPVKEGIDVLAPVYNFLKKKDYKISKEHIMVEGVPVRFIPVYNDLIKEAVLHSRKVKYGTQESQVVALEYLIAILVQTYRAKDRERLVTILEVKKYDSKRLTSILKKFNLYDKFIKFRSGRFGKD
ncbi:MAG: hypothetical protein JXB26_08740 [Candidatus Aminicenantes bacterium]|nr:hypothetical protein [Candidatus Aminicenantes bacterium]